LPLQCAEYFWENALTGLNPHNFAIFSESKHLKNGTITIGPRFLKIL